VALRPTQFLEGPSKCIDASLCFWIILSICRQHADAPHALGLLRARRERQSGCAAEQRDELAAL
jgi:hypothetical protein